MVSSTVLFVSRVGMLFCVQWVSGTGYPRFKVSFNFSRKHNSADYRVEQLIRDASRVFHGDVTFRMIEATGRLVDKKGKVHAVTVS